MRLIIFTFLLLFAVTSGAQTIDVLYEGGSEKRLKTQARQEIMDQAVEKTSFKYVSEIIGKTKATRNKTLIENKIIRQSGKYVLFIKTDKISRSTGDSDVYKMNVSMKISLDSLRKLLLSNGLLYKTEGAPKVLPLIVIDDRTNSDNFTWWAKTEGRLFLKNEMIALHKNLREAFAHRQFFSITPIKNSLQLMVPEQLKLENPRLSDLQLLGEFFEAQIILKGKVQIKKAETFSDQQEISFSLMAYQTENGRLIADVKRQYKTKPGEFKSVVHKKLSEVEEAITGDLVSQVYSAWQKGTFGSSLIRITLNGGVNYKNLNLVKTQMSHLKEIRAIRERFFSREKVSFEVDASVLPAELAQVIGKITSPNYRLKLDRVASNEIEFDFKARR